MLKGLKLGLCEMKVFLEVLERALLVVAHFILPQKLILFLDHHPLQLLVLCLGLEPFFSKIMTIFLVRLDHPFNIFLMSVFE